MTKKLPNWKISGQLLYPAKLNPWHLLHKSGAVAMVFGPWDFFWGGNFLHADGLAEGFEESEPTKDTLPKTNMAMENFIFNRKHIFKSRNFRCHVSFRGGNPTKLQRLFQLFHQNKIDST